MKLYADRRAAGRELASWLPSDALLLALPRGGVPLAQEVAAQNSSLWDIWLVRKMAKADNPEFALGALAEKGIPLWNEPRHLHAWDMKEMEKRARKEMKEQSREWRGNGPPDVQGKKVIVIDDGLATGSTARAVARVLRDQGASEVWGAFPVGPPGVARSLLGDFDHVVCPEEPKDFHFVAAYYKNFDPVSSEEVQKALAASRRPVAS